MHFKQIIMLCKFRFITLLLCITEVQGRLASFPKNNVAIIGNPNVFTCCSNIQQAIFWKHKPVGSQNAHDIDDLNGLVNGFRTSGRFNVTPISSAGCQNLITANVRRGDEGSYSCIDNEGFGQQIGWELVVLESFDCQESNRKDQYAGANDYDLPQDVIIIVCIVKYFGNIHPTPICIWSSGTALLDNHQHTTETNSTITLNIHIPATKEINGYHLSCYVTINGESSGNPTPIAWKSSHFKIKYKQAATTIHSSTHDSVVKPNGKSEYLMISTIVVLSGLLFICTPVMLFCIFRGRRRSPQRNVHVEAIPIAELRPPASINIGDGANVTVNASPNARSSNSQKNVVHSENRNAKSETVPFIAGHSSNERPNFVINGIEGLHLSFRNASTSSLQQDDVNVALDNKSHIKEVYTLKKNLRPTKDSLMLSTIASESQTMTIGRVRRKPVNRYAPVKREPASMYRSLPVGIPLY